MNTTTSIIPARAAVTVKLTNPTPDEYRARNGRYVKSKLSRHCQVSITVQLVGFADQYRRPAELSHRVTFGSSRETETEEFGPWVAGTGTYDSDFRMFTRFANQTGATDVVRSTLESAGLLEAFRAAARAEDA